jgi:hypothetical protein
MTPPATNSAAATARVISQRLRRAGFPMADTSNRYFWTEGYVVRRIGFGTWVDVCWHDPTAGHLHHAPEAVAGRRARHDDLLAALAGWGYTLVPRDRYAGIAVECQGP